MEGVAALSGADIRMLAETQPFGGDKGLHVDGEPEDQYDPFDHAPDPPKPTEDWTSADKPYIGPLEKGQRVHYWSETHTQWIWTHVVHSSADTGPVDLHIKQNASRQKIRNDWFHGFDRDGQPVFYPRNSKHRAARQDGHGDLVDHRAEDLVPPKKKEWFPEVGENVQYWSPTFNKYIAAFVKAINAPVNGDGEWTLDLNVKKRASVSSVYPGNLGELAPPPAAAAAALPLENTPRQPKEVPDRSQTPLRANGRREDRSVRSQRTSYVRSPTTAPNSSRSRGDAEEKHALQRTMEPEQLALRQSAQRDMPDVSLAAFDTSPTSAVEALGRVPATAGPAGYPSGSTSYAPPGQTFKAVITSAGAGAARLAGPSTTRKPDLKPVPEMSIASAMSGDSSLQVSVRAGQDAREPASRLSIASPSAGGTSLTSPAHASTKATPSFAPPTQYARSLTASTSSLSSALPTLREQLRVPWERVDVGQIGPQIMTALGGPSCHVQVQRLGAGGGQNMGIWQLTIPPPAQQIIGHKVLIVKMVAARSSHHMLDSEADHICKLAEACPAIREDPKLTFPIKVLDLVPPSNRVQHNLMIMPAAKGEILANYFCMSISAGKSQELMGALKMLGRELKLFHQRYNNRKHADFTPSNIFYDPQNKSFTFIDIGGVGTTVMETDDEHFVKSLQLTCGPRTPYAPFLPAAVNAFRQGYMSA